MRCLLVGSSMLLASAAAAAPATITTAPSGREVRVELIAQYADNQIGSDKVNLRSYNGGLVGPTIRARAGDTLNVHLVNRLPPNPKTPSNAAAPSPLGRSSSTRSKSPPITRLALSGTTLTCTDRPPCR